MREILFRGKAKDGKWYFGDLQQFNSGFVYIQAKKEGESNFVIPETVGQFIGITDKNGVKIFEGDIVKMSFIEEGEEWEPEYLTVYWDEKVNGFLCHSNQTTMSEESDLLSDGEVIGNIHDNPELLEVEE